MSNLEPDAFEQQVRDCLTHYYDYAFLQNHPLVRRLAANAPGDAGCVQIFREIVEQSIERMKSGPDSEPSKQARLYNILLFRYINQQQVQQVLYRLNLGERQFYRDHNKAIRTLSGILWEHAEQTPADSPAAPDSSISIQSEIQRVYNQARPEQISVRTFLEKTLMSIHGLLERYQAHIAIEIMKDSALLTIDTAVLRQAIISILSRLVIQSAPDSTFTLSYRDDGADSHFTFTCNVAANQAYPSPLLPEQQTLLHDLMLAVGGYVEESRSAGQDYHIHLCVPLHKTTMLLIDDNPDAIALFQRYLSGQPYHILTAYDGERALQLAREASPELIILDVLLPQQDGWEILQTLKSHPLTSAIPVLICSVLASPELARALGADGYLHKPPTEAEFLATLSHFCYSLDKHPQ